VQRDLILCCDEVDSFFDEREGSYISGGLKSLSRSSINMLVLFVKTGSEVESYGHYIFGRSQRALNDEECILLRVGCGRVYCEGEVLYAQGTFLITVHACLERPCFFRRLISFQDDQVLLLMSTMVELGWSSLV